MDPILIFLAIAVFIIAVAVLVSRAFVKPGENESDPKDGEALATWIGVDETKHD